MSIEIIGIIVASGVILSLIAIIMLIILLANKHWAKESYDKIGRFESDVKTNLNEVPQKLQEVKGFIKDNSEKVDATKTELTKSFIDFQNSVGLNINEMTKRIDTLTNNVNTSLNSTKDSVGKSLDEIRTSNEKKLEAIRNTVDEKLNETLTRRINESFKTVSENLIAVSKELGSVQNIVKDVGSLKQIFSNAKQKGMFGEYELESLLSDMLAPTQYIKDARINPSKSSKLVEFAVKVPNKTKDGINDFAYMPIDSKFPTADYERLLEDYDNADKEAVKKDRERLGNKIKTYAKDIKDKYIEPPHTTNIGLMFLPSEALYAEVMRINGLFQEVQRNFNITIVSPTTMQAFLYILQMSYRSVAVETETQKIIGLLGNVKNSFIDFNKLLDTAKNQSNAGTNINKAQEDSRKIFTKLSEIDNFEIENKNNDINKLETTSDADYQKGKALQGEGAYA